MKVINLLQLLGLVFATLYITSCYGGEWHTHGNYKYFFEDAINSWNVSRMKCEGMNASLLSINDKEENDFIERHVGSETTRFRLEYWIGLTTISSCNTCRDQNVNNTLCLIANDTNSCCECRCQWQWIDGSHMTFMKWQHDEPTGGNFCGALREPRPDHYAQEGWYWYDNSCSEHKLSICKKVISEEESFLNESHASTEYTSTIEESTTVSDLSVQSNQITDMTVVHDISITRVDERSINRHMQRAGSSAVIIALAVSLSLCFTSCVIVIGVALYRRQKNRKHDALYIDTAQTSGQQRSVREEGCNSFDTTQNSRRCNMGEKKDHVHYNTAGEILSKGLPCSEIAQLENINLNAENAIQRDYYNVKSQDQIPQKQMDLQRTSNRKDEIEYEQVDVETVQLDFYQEIKTENENIGYTSLDALDWLEQAPGNASNVVYEGLATRSGQV